MLTFGVIEHDQCCATLVGAQMQFCFADFDSETSTCQGNLLGTVNSAEDCCQPIPLLNLSAGGRSLFIIRSLLANAIHSANLQRYGL